MIELLLKLGFKYHSKTNWYEKTTSKSLPWCRYIVDKDRFIYFDPIEAEGSYLPQKEKLQDVLLMLYVLEVIPQELYETISQEIP